MRRKQSPLGMRKVTPRPMRRLTPVPRKRRDRRYLVPLPVTLFLAKRWIEAEAADVCHGGLFVLLEEELRGAAPADDASDLLYAGRLVRIEVVLPPDNEPFAVTGRLVHQRPAFLRDGRRGVGVELYGIGAAPLARWSAFIDHVRQAYPASDERRVTLATAEQVDASFLRSREQVGTLRVEPGSVRDLVAISKRDLGRGTIFLVSGARAFVDDELLLQVVHPLTDDVFELVGRVRRVVEDAGLRGLDVALVGCDDARRERFEEFVYDAMAPMFDDEELRLHDD